jgi:ABC-type glycerol-3-phosphate transport system substrate-binding protein
MVSRKVSRRRFVASTAAASTALVAAPFVRGAYAAGKLSLDLWDHWVPGANKATEDVIKAWADKEKVDVTIDFITSQGNKLLLTTAAESQAKSGHDVLAFSTWLPAQYSDQLVAMNDVVEPLIKQNGAVNGTVEYLGKIGGKWLAVPATVGSQIKGPCSRIDLMKQLAGIDVQAMYPAGAPPKADAWTLDAFLKAAEACHKGGSPFGIGLGTTSDSVDTAGAIFHSFGAVLVDAKGDITVKNDKVRQALEYYKKLMSFLPEDAPAWDDASNNKWLVSGKGALIMNPPSAWAVAKRDAPKIAEQSWHFPGPKGPKGRVVAASNFFWGAWNFSKNPSAAKSLIHFLGQYKQAEQLVAASQGFDLASFEKQHDFKTWAEQGPPSGTLYHYPPRGDVIGSTCGAPAPTRIGTQMFAHGTMAKMINQATIGGRTIEQATAWAASELEGFMRT